MSTVSKTRINPLGALIDSCMYKAQCGSQRAGIASVKEPIGEEDGVRGPSKTPPDSETLLWRCHPREPLQTISPR